MQKFERTSAIKNEIFHATFSIQPISYILLFDTSVIDTSKPEFLNIFSFSSNNCEVLSNFATAKWDLFTTPVLLIQSAYPQSRPVVIIIFAQLPLIRPLFKINSTWK